jgi:hypothetical protein
METDFFVYYETMKREIKRRPIYEFQCDERLKVKSEGPLMFIWS